MANYELTITAMQSENGEQVETYGLRCGSLEYPDVCCDRGAMEALVAQCNELDLAPEHLRDVVCDFLSQSRANKT